MSIIARSTRMKALWVWRSRVTALMWRGGRSFHTVAPETENARLPTIERRMRGTAKWWEEDDRNRCLDVMSATRVKQDWRYLDAVSWMDRGVISMKLVTNIRHMSGHCRKGFQGPRSKVKVTARPVNGVCLQHYRLTSLVITLSRAVHYGGGILFDGLASRLSCFVQF